MHITTFYSFKGGVGRTQALVNVGVELAQRGRRVLLVDFDLDAPGVDSYPLPRPKDATPGLVEFITAFVETSESPDATRHIYECRNVGRLGGRLWVMPSGNQDASYARRLSEIDWPRLYADRDGYLLLEDLKRQWQESLAPDYVLIDSRTGHGDVAGICTRQLPDSVVILFFPTDQNLRGLPKVVDDIRAEADGPRQKKISLLFVMSNVPDLDDEDQILETRIRLFAETLKYGQLDALVHRYDSLALLNQVIFTSDRPKSRLAREYHGLTDKIVQKNLSDREGALTFIRQLLDRPRAAAELMNRSDIDERLDLVRRTHEADHEILEQLAELRMREGRFEDASALWSQLVDMQVATPHVLLRRSEARTMTANKNGALEDLEAFLRSSNAADIEVSRSLSLLASLAPDRLRTVAAVPAIQHLSADIKYWVAHQLEREPEGLYAARDIFAQLLKAPADTPAKQPLTLNALAVVLCGLGQVVEARDLLADSTTRTTSLPQTFNYAMASWAADGLPKPELFAKVLPLDVDNGTANHAQCLAVTFAVLARSDEAVEQIHVARQRAAARPDSLLSCWRYRIVPPALFLTDLEAILRFLNGEPVRPAFAPGLAPTHSLADHD